jgi:hypothetical protein
LERLKNRGLIEEKAKGKSIFNDRSDRSINVRDSFLITEKGERYLQAIDDRGLGDELKRIATTTR